MIKVYDNESSVMIMKVQLLYTFVSTRLAASTSFKFQ